MAAVTAGRLRSGPRVASDAEDPPRSYLETGGMLLQEAADAG